MLRKTFYRVGKILVYKDLDNMLIDKMEYFVWWSQKSPLLEGIATKLIPLKQGA